MEILEIRNIVCRHFVCFAIFISFLAQSSIKHLLLVSMFECVYCMRTFNCDVLGMCFILEMLVMC